MENITIFKGNDLMAGMRGFNQKLKPLTTVTPVKLNQQLLLTFIQL